MSVFSGIQLPKTIYTTESKYNGKIEVMEIGKTRKIKVDKATQSLNWDSPSAENLVWGKIVKTLKEEEPLLSSVLILGLGGGTIQHLISHIYPGIRIVSIEIDQVMEDIAKNYFDIGSIPNHQIIIEDACRVIVEPETYGLNVASFGAVIVDIYCGEKYPELGKSGNFISALKKMTVPGGLIIFNRMYHEPHQDDVNIFTETVSEFLADVKQLIVAGYTNSDNILIYGRV